MVLFSMQDSSRDSNSREAFRTTGLRRTGSLRRWAFCLSLLVLVALAGQTFAAPAVADPNKPRATDPSLAAMGFDQMEWYAAPSDYCSTEKIRGGFRRLSGDTSLGDALGVLSEHMNFSFAGWVDSPPSNFACILDGTSNTFIVGERTGGDTIYEGTQEADVSAIASALGIANWQVAGGNGGGWGDVLNGELDFQGSVHGAISAAIFATGPCAINCSNMRELSFHSFHPGGANFVMADGSVQLITATIHPGAFAARYTRDGGEVVGD